MLADLVNRDSWTRLEWSYHRIKRGYYTLTDIGRVVDFFTS